MVFYLFKVVAYTPTIVTEFTTVARESRFGSRAPICCTFVNWFTIINRQVTDNYITERHKSTLVYMSKKIAQRPLSWSQNDLMGNRGSTIDML
jgi:hypothetical protein